MNMKNLALLLLCALVAMTGGVADAAERSVYLVPDAQGSAVAAMDAQGAVLWRESYAPYGERRTRAAANPGNPAYTGKPEDRDTGLVYMGARWYDTESARFTGNDPQGFSAGNPQSFGRYLYANNAPFTFVDPNGEAPTPLDGLLLAIDAGGLALAIYSGNPAAVAAAEENFAQSVAGLFVPAPGGKWVIKAAAAARDAKRVAKGASGGPRAGKVFTPKGKAEIDAENAARNGGVNVCENCGTVVVPAKRSERGVAPPTNERHRDHIEPRSKGGDGDPSNGQILCRGCNLAKGDN